MRYDIRLRLGYAYQDLVAEARHLVRVAPRDLPGVQQVQGLRLRIDPAPSERDAFDDFFGNRVTSIALRTPHDAFEVEMRAQVRVDRGRQDVPDLSPGVDGGVSGDVSAGIMPDSNV